MASLLGNPLFGAGMGLLGAGFDRRINPATAAMQGLQGASYYQNAALDRQRQQQEWQQRQDALNQIADPQRRAMAVLGMSSQSAPSNVREYQYFESLGDGSGNLTEAQKQYLNVKRAGSTYSAAGVPGYRSPAGDTTELVTPETVEERLAGQAAAKTTATARAEAQQRLPAATATAASTIGVIDRLRNHPGRKLATGKSAMVPLVQGTNAYDFSVLLEQARGKAFLEVYEQLRGGGQITENETRQAGAALARLDRAQSEEAFLTALDDFESAVKSGLQKLEAEAGVEPSGLLSDGPSVGDVEDGYEFLGGDPADPNSWRKK